MAAVQECSNQVSQHRRTDAANTLGDDATKTVHDTDQQPLGSVRRTTAEDAANGAVDTQFRPRDPRLDSLERKAGSDGDNGDSINAVGGRKSNRENDRRQSDHNGRATTREMLSANLQNLGAGTRGNDTKAPQQEPPEIRPERVGRNAEEERKYGVRGGQRADDQDTDEEGPPESRARNPSGRRAHVTNTARRRCGCSSDSRAYDRMHDDAGVDDRRGTPGHRVGGRNDGIIGEYKDREKGHNADASLRQRRGRPGPERVPRNGLLGRDSAHADADRRDARGNDATGGQETGGKTAQTNAGDDRGRRAER